MKKYLMNTRFGEKKQENEAVINVKENAKKQNCKFISCLSEVLNDLQSENVVLDYLNDEQLMISVF